MTARLHHEWVEGAHILGSRLSTCTHCHTLRVIAHAGPVNGIPCHGEEVYIRPSPERKPLPEHERVTTTPPACVTPS